MEMTKNGIVYDVKPHGAVVLRPAWKTTPTQSIKIPSSVFNKEVYRIEAGAFKNSDILGVILPLCLESIGEEAFANCKHLSHVEFGKRGDAAKEISVEKRAFYGCSNLNFVLGKSWWNLEESAFENCTVMQFYGMVKTADSKAFKGCRHLDNLNILLGGKIAIDALDINPNLSVLPCGGPITYPDIQNIFESLKEAQATIRCFPSDNITQLAYEGYKLDVVQV